MRFIAMSLSLASSLREAQHPRDPSHRLAATWLNFSANQVAKSMTCNQHGLPLFDSIRLC